MCKVIDFNENRRNMAVRKMNQTAKALRIGQKNNGTGLKTLEKHGGNGLGEMGWIQEYVQDRWSLSKLMCRIIEHYGYLCCVGGRKYVFEDIKRDVKYCEMVPEVENKRYKAPLWVKVKGEWYFIEVYADYASMQSFDKKWRELGNYNIKGILIRLSGLKSSEMKRLVEEHDLSGIAEKVKHAYEDTFNYELETECRCSVCFGREKKERRCSYKLLELKRNEFVVLEGTELKTGDKHLVMLYAGQESKEYAGYFKERFGHMGLPFYYGQWEPEKENWQICITRKNKLNKKIMLG